MMSYIERRGPGLKLRRLGALIAFLAAVLAGLGVSASVTNAESVGFEFDRGVINLGGEEEGVWAKVIDPDVEDPSAFINAEVADDGTLTAAKNHFVFPPKRIEDLETGNGTLPFVDANIVITADADITGTYDRETGDAEILLPADVFITVYSAGSPVSVAKCRVDGFDLTLRTSGGVSDPGDESADPPRPAADYDGSPFVEPEKTGAVLASWEGLPSSQNEGGSLGGIVCPALDGMLGGPGAIWLSGKADGVIDIPAPTKAPKLTGTPAASTTSTSASFEFEAGEGETSPVNGFVCKFDSGEFSACDDGRVEYTGLAVGSHTFEVRAANDTGEGPGATYKWEVAKPEICPPGTTGTPPDCKSPKLANLKIKPKVRAIKRGGKTIIRVTVRNRGDSAAAAVKICAKAPKRLVRVKKCVNLGRIAASGSKTARFKVTAKRARGRAVLKFTATSRNAGKKTGKARVKVK